MPTVEEIKLELDDAQTLKLISSAFTEASAAKIQKIKKQFETNREFYEEISRVYHVVQASGSKMTGKDGPKKRETKELYVAITSNQRFYGNLNINIMNKFLQDVSTLPGDMIVIGATGQDQMKSVTLSKPYEKIHFPKEYPSKEETRTFLERIKPYTSIILYYPKFVSLMTQTVGILDISQTAGVKDVGEDEVYILFEPEYTQTLDFFETQVRSLLFLRVMLEADLARTAARMITMSGAEERSNETIKIKKSQLRKIKSSIINAKLLETFSAIKGSKHD